MFVISLLRETRDLQANDDRIAILGFSVLRPHLNDHPVLGERTLEYTPSDVYRIH
jgi:hypothetical protein